MKELKTTVECNGKYYDVVTKEFPECGIVTRIYKSGETNENEQIHCIHIDTSDIRSEHYGVCARIEDYFPLDDADSEEDDDESKDNKDSVTITREEFITAMAKAFAECIKGSNNLADDFMAAVVTGAVVIKKVSKILFEKKGE